MLNHSSREVTLKPPRPHIRRDEYEMTEPGECVVTRYDDLEDVAIELEVRVVGRDFQLVSHEFLRVDEINPFAETVTDTKLRHEHGAEVCDHVALPGSRHERGTTISFALDAGHRPMKLVSRASSLYNLINPH